MARTFLAVSWILGRTDYGSEPDAALLIEHRVMHVGLAVPDGFVAPVGRRLHRFPRSGRLGIANRHSHMGRRVVHWIEHGNVIGAQLGSAVEQAVGVDRRIS